MLNIKKLIKILSLVRKKELINLLIHKSDEQIDNIIKFCVKYNTTKVETIVFIKKYFENEEIYNFVLTYAYPYRTFEQVIKLINIYINNESYIIENDRFDIFKYHLCNEDLIYYRTYEEQIKLIGKYLESEIDVYVSNIITERKILMDRTYQEQMGLIETYLKSGKDKGVYDIIMNLTILCNRTYEEQIKLIEVYLKNGKDKGIYQIVKDSDIVFKKTCEEQMKLIETYLKSGKDEGVCRIITISRLSQRASCNQLIELIGLYLFNGKDKNILHILENDYKYVRGKVDWLYNSVEHEKKIINKYLKLKRNKRYYQLLTKNSEDLKGLVIEHSDLYLKLGKKYKFSDIPRIIYMSKTIPEEYDDVLFGTERDGESDDKITCAYLSPPKIFRR